MPERNYTYAELRAMQQDAIERVMEMQRRANERLGRTPHSGGQNRVSNQNNAGNLFSQPQSQATSQARSGNAPPRSMHPSAPQGESFFSSGAFEGIAKRLGLESDQLLLIGLLLLQLNEGADAELILGIFYLLI